MREGKQQAKQQGNPSLLLAAIGKRDIGDMLGERQATPNKTGGGQPPGNETKPSDGFGEHCANLAVGVIGSRPPLLSKHFKAISGEFSPSL